MHSQYIQHLGRSSVAFQTVVAVFALAALLALSFTHAAPDAAAVWVSDQKQLKRVDPAVNQYVQAIALSNAAEAIAFDAKNNTLWALANKHLLKFNAAGALAADIDLAPSSQPAEALKRLALDPYDGSLWLAGEKTVLHVSAQGQTLLKWTSPINIQAIAPDPDQSLWVLTQGSLYQLSITGTVLDTLAIPNTLIPDPTFLALDGLGGYLWVAGKRHLVRFDANDLTAPPLTAPLPATVNGTNNKIETLLTHPLFGTVWAASTDSLLLFDSNAGLVRQVNLTPQGLGIPQAIAYEPGSASLWLGGKAALARFTPNGDFVAKLPADIAISALATGPFSVSPTLTLLEPINNSVTNNPRPPFRLGLGAECNGQPCDLVDAYTQAFTLDATLNGLSIGSLFNLANREALYIPPTRLPEGVNLFTAQATDVFGHLSNRINGQVTIDTIPPRFLSLNPADGSTLTTGTITVSGTLDDATASTLLQDHTGQVLGMASGTAFSFAVILKPGLNTFALTARDPAGNSSQVGLRLTYLQPIVLKVTSPKDGDTVTTTSIAVTGTLDAPAGTTVNVNGVYATIDAAGNFSAGNVPIVAGKNILTVTANVPDGRTITQSLIVYSLQINWGTPELIATLPSQASEGIYGGYPYYLQTTIDGDGSIHVVWMSYQKDIKKYSIYTSRYTKESGWGAATKIVSLDHAISSVHLAGNYQGNGILVWHEHVPISPWPPIASLHVAHFKKATGWEPPKTIRNYKPYSGYGPGDPGRPDYPLLVAMDGIGNAFLLWNEDAYDNSGTVIRSIVNRFDVSNSSNTLSYIYQRAAAEGIAADYFGNAIAVLTDENFAADQEVFSKHYTIGKGWGPEINSHNDIKISGPSSIGSGFYFSKIAMNANGHALVVWDAGYNNYANQYNSGEKTWGKPQLLNRPNQGIFHQEVKINTEGNGVVVGEREHGSVYDPEGRKQEIWVSQYRPGQGWSEQALISQQEMKYKHSFDPWNTDYYYPSSTIKCNT